MKKERPIRLHKFTDRRPLLCTLLWMGCAYLFIELFIAVVGAPLSLLTSVPHGSSIGKSVSDALYFAGCCAGVPASFLVLAAFRWWYRGEFSGTLGKTGLWKTTAALGGIAAYWVIGTAAFLLQGGSLHIPEIKSIAVSLMAGVSEEVLFRALPICILARCRKDDEKKHPRIVLFSAACFGLVHATNALMGANPAGTALQVVEAACIGIYFGAVYLRGGNLWPLIAAHTLNDILAFASSESADLSSAGIILADVSRSDLFDLALCLVLAAIGMILIRKQKRPAITAVWSDKWRLSVAADDEDAEFTGIPQTDNETEGENET